MTKTVLTYLQDLPDPFRDQALKNCNRNQTADASHLYRALDKAFLWVNSPQGEAYWAGVFECLGGYADVVVRNRHKTEFIRAQILYKEAKQNKQTSTPTNNNTTVNLTKYKTTPVSNPTLVFGEDVTDITTEDAIKRIQEYKNRIKELEAVEEESSFIANEIAGLKEAVSVLVKHLDSTVAATPA